MRIWLFSSSPPSGLSAVWDLAAPESSFRTALPFYSHLYPDPQRHLLPPGPSLLGSPRSQTVPPFPPASGSAFLSQLSQLSFSCFQNFVAPMFFVLLSSLLKKKQPYCHFNEAQKGVDIKCMLMHHLGQEVSYWQEISH